LTQLMIDTQTDSVDTLHRVAKFLMDEADARFEKGDRTYPAPSDTAPAVISRDDSGAAVPAGTDTAVQFAARDAIGPPVPPIAPNLDVFAPDTNIDTAAIFRKNAPAGLDGHGETPSNVLPFVAPPPPVSGATAPAASLRNVPEPRTAETATVPGATVVLDSAGIPWDARIHQDTRKMNKNKTWQNKRGIDKDLLAAVTAELQAAWGKPAAAPAPAFSSAPVAPPPPPVAPVVAQAAPVAPQPPVAPAPPGPPGVPPAPGVIVGFRELMQKITSNTNSGKLSNEQVDAALGSVGLPPRQLIALVNQPTLIPGVSAYIDACLAA
jgi:hypothetical protein